MSFWAYMLHCKGGAFYTGHTDNLELRIAGHQQGQIKGFTTDKLPVELVWSAEFHTRLEALGAERRIKGWSRLKKMALIRGDWNEISRLARKKNSPSTSSGRTGLGDERTRLSLAGEGSKLIRLKSHPAFPPTSVRSVKIEVTATDWCDVLIVFRIDGEDIVRGEWEASKRTDGLWKSTCFEVFLRDPLGESYFEYNFAPSCLWAAYRFEKYREGMRDLEMAVEPHLEFDRLKPLELSVDLDLSNLPKSELLVNFAAVIEETDGTKSYWALAHPDGPPDFHDPSCFVAHLPAIACP